MRYKVILVRTDRPEREVVNEVEGEQIHDRVPTWMGNMVASMARTLDERVRVSLLPCKASLIYGHGEHLCQELGQDHTDHENRCRVCWQEGALWEGDDDCWIPLRWTDPACGLTDVTTGRQWLSAGSGPPLGESMILENPSGERVVWNGKRWHSVGASWMEADAWGPDYYSPGPWRPVDDQGAGS